MIGIIAAGVLVVPLSGVFFYILKGTTVGLRVSEETEASGLDKAELTTEAYPQNSWSSYTDWYRIELFRLPEFWQNVSLVNPVLYLVSGFRWSFYEMADVSITTSLIMILVQEEITGSFKQYPMRLAWAITIHKSQGQTFEKVIIDMSLSQKLYQKLPLPLRCNVL